MYWDLIVGWGGRAARDPCATKNQPECFGEIVIMVVGFAEGGERIRTS